MSHHRQTHSPVAINASKLIPLFIATAMLLGVAPSGFSGTMGEPGGGGDLVGVAEREIARRQQAMNEARDLIAQGDQAMRDKDYEQAVGLYRGAFEMLPDADVSASLRAEALDKFCAASMRLAEQRITEGEYAQAREIAEGILELNPHYKPALVLLARLEDPTFYNTAVTPTYVADVEQVRQWLLDAENFYKTGQFDLAIKRTDQVLNLDPYNKAARRLQEEVYVELDRYGKDAYNTARQRYLSDLQRAWQPPVQPFLDGPAAGPIDADGQDQSLLAANNAKLDQVVIPRIDLRDATVREAIDFLKQESVRRDETGLGGQRGINIVVNLDAGVDAAAAAPEAGEAGGLPGAGLDPNNLRITVELSNIPLREALRYVTNLAGLKYKVEPFAVLVVPLNVATDDLFTKTYRVPPTFLLTPLSATPTGTGAEPQFGMDPGAGGAAPPTAREFLENAGVTFPEGASATYFPATSRLIVKNTQTNLDLIDELVAQTQQLKPRQVEIESKFVEVTQNDLKELSFDWLLGQFNVGSSARTFGGGGTPGPLRSDTITGAEFPFTDPVNNNPIGNNPLTGGNRTGTGALGAITGNAIDSLLFGIPSGVAPGTFSLAGVFTDPQFQLVIRALDQKKGVDLLSAPRVTTRSGQRAVIEIIRELRYPTEFESPQVPQEIQGGSVVVAPTTPTTFETRNTGVTLEVEPTVGPDGYTIDLNLIPQVVEFEGFINYGSPIFGLGLSTDDLGFFSSSDSVLLTDNVINQPVFSTRKVQTSVTIWDGQTVVIGGLMREDVQKVEDKVPVLGDIPLLGRAFRSSVDQHLKRNLIIFVTTRLIDPAGQPIKLSRAEEAILNEDQSIEEPGLLLPPADVLSTP